MPDKPDFAITFQKLKAILQPYAQRLIVVHDTSENYYLDTPHVMKNKHRVFFAAVRMGKNYVSFHLMPVYGSTELRDMMSPELKKRMQGKSCFNFKAASPALFSELESLTRLGHARFVTAGFVPA